MRTEQRKSRRAAWEARPAPSLPPSASARIEKVAARFLGYAKLLGKSKEEKAYWIGAAKRLRAIGIPAKERARVR